MRAPMKPVASPALVPLILGTLAAATAAVPCVRDMEPVRDTLDANEPAGVAITASTAAVAAMLLFLALRTHTRGAAYVAMTVGGVAAGAANAGVALCLVTLVKDGRFEPMMVVVGALFGIFYAGPLGAAFGLVLSFVVVPAGAARRERAFDGFDRVLLRGGLLVLAVGAACLYFDRAARPLDFLAVSTGAVAVCAASARLVARRRWLARVRRGAVPGWRVEARGGTSDGVGLLPFVGGRAYASVLVRDEREVGVPYRDPPVRRAVALVP